MKPFERQAKAVDWECNSAPSQDRVESIRRALVAAERKGYERGYYKATQEWADGHESGYKRAMKELKAKGKEA